MHHLGRVPEGQLLYLPLMIRADLGDLVEQYAPYAPHYDYFWNQAASRTIVQADFDVKFEMRLVFLVEAIGVPVLLSLLLLAYSDTSDEVLEVTSLPIDRLNLYEVGVLRAIRKRLLIIIANELGEEVTKEAAIEEVGDKEGGEGGRKKEKAKRASMSELMGGEAQFATAGSKAEEKDASSNNKHKQKKESEEPYLDLGSILRGKKVKVVHGSDAVSECYALVVRVLNKVNFSKLIPVESICHHPWGP